MCVCVCVFYFSWLSFHGYFSYQQMPPLVVISRLNDLILAVDLRGLSAQNLVKHAIDLLRVTDRVKGIHVVGMPLWWWWWYIYITEFYKEGNMNDKQELFRGLSSLLLKSKANEKAALSDRQLLWWETASPGAVTAACTVIQNNNGHCSTNLDESKIF